MMWPTWTLELSCIRDPLINVGLLVGGVKWLIHSAVSGTSGDHEGCRDKRLTWTTVSSTDKIPRGYHNMKVIDDAAAAPTHSRLHIILPRSLTFPAWSIYLPELVRCIALTMVSSFLMVYIISIHLTLRFASDQEFIFDPGQNFDPRSFFWPGSDF